MYIYIYIYNNVGDRIPPCFTQLNTGKYSDTHVFHDTRDCYLVYASNIRQIKPQRTSHSINISNNFPK